MKPVIQTIPEIKAQLETVSDQNDPLIKALKKDKRRGVQQLLSQWRRMKEKEKKVYNHFKEMTAYETYYQQKGFSLIAGIDEAGRGPLAGPVVAAAVILPMECYLPGLNDSKQVSKGMRDELYHNIKELALAIGVGMVHAEEIDSINIYQATKKAMIKAVHQLPIQPDFLLIDAVPLLHEIPAKPVIGGDGKSISIAAASIVAKVTRDRFMVHASSTYSDYGFEEHKGYATKKHLDAIQKYGVTPLHRASFAHCKGKE